MQCINNYGSSSSGRIWGFWDSRKVRIREISQNDQVIHVEVENFMLKSNFVLSMVYDANLLDKSKNL